MSILTNVSIIFYIFNTNERNKNEKKVIKANLMYKHLYKYANSTKNELCSCATNYFNSCLWAGGWASDLEVSICNVTKEELFNS